MDWNHIANYLIAGLVPVITAALVLALRVVLRLMIQHKSVIVHTIGELAYQEIEKNFTGDSGAVKLQRALQAARQRIGDNPFLKNVNDEQLIAAIQKAWEQNEGQHKVTDSSDVQP